MAGYVLNNEATLKLRGALSGTYVPDWQFGGVLYPFTEPIRERIQRDLRGKRVKFEVNVELVGAGDPLGTITVTQCGYGPGGSPPPEAVEGELEEIIREWLQEKGNLPTFLDRCFLTLSIGITWDEYQWGGAQQDWGWPIGQDMWSRPERRFHKIHPSTTLQTIIYPL